MALSRFGTTLLLSAALMGPLAAQTPPKKGPAVSPVAPGDLTKPVFDTKTAVYDQRNGLSKSASTIVAEVEGRAITLGDVGDAIRALPPALARLPFDALFPGVLEQLIKQQALVVKAQQRGLDEDPAIRRRVKAAGERTLAEEYLRTELAKDVTENTLLERYNRDIAGKPGPDEVRIRLILVPTEQEALSLLAEIKGGADFAATAKRASKDPTAAAGGDVGFNPREGLTPEVGAVAFAIPPGQLVPYPVRSNGQWFVIRVEERRARPTPSFASVRDSLMDAVLREGVVPFSAAAVAAMKVREYNLMGRENETKE